MWTLLIVLLIGVLLLFWYIRSVWRSAGTASQVSSALVATVAFRDLDESAPGYDGQNGYTYKWPFDKPPEVGDRVMVPGWDGITAAVVIYCGATPGSEGMQLKTVSSLVTEEAIRRAQVTAEKDLVSWLDMARRAAGLPVPGRARQNPPSGFDPVPPVEGHAAPALAADYARVWWIAYRRAEEIGRSPDEVATFRQIGSYWYGVADPADLIAGLRKGKDGWMASILSKLPATTTVPDSDVVAAYFAALGVALEDGKLIGDEARLLASMALDACLGPRQIGELNRRFLDGLRAAALDDGILTALEVRDLKRAGVALTEPEYFADLTPVGLSDDI